MEDRSGVKIPPPLIYLAGFGAGLALEGAFPVEAPAAAVRWIAGIAGVALWIWLDGDAMARFRRAGTSPLPMRPSSALVSTGAYRLTRNPMYLGMTCLYAGLAVATGVILALALLPVVLLVVDRYVIAREERYLERKFGQPYLDYKRSVRRWL